MTHNLNQSASARKPKSRGSYSHTNFIEALKSTGSSIVKDTAKSLKNDLAKGSANQIIDSALNTNQQNSQEQPQNQENFNFEEYLKSGEKHRQHDKVKYEYEQQEVVIFNRRQEEINGKIEEIRVELKRLAQEIVYLDHSTETVIQEEVVKPGTYHLNFFEKLLGFIKGLRKRVAESRHWASMHNQRQQHKSYYWHMANSKRGGTKFSLSHERTVATQTG